MKEGWRGGRKGRGWRDVGRRREGRREGGREGGRP